MARKWKRKYASGAPRPEVLEPWLEDTLVYKGLEMVRYYCPYAETTWWGEWELVFTKTQAPLMLIMTKSDLAALKIATKVADLADWESFETKPRWYSTQISEELRSFMRSKREYLGSPDLANGPNCTLEDLGISLPADDNIGEQNEEVLTFRWHTEGAPQPSSAR